MALSMGWMFCHHSRSQILISHWSNWDKVTCSKSQQEDPGGNRTHGPRIRSPISLEPRLSFGGGGGEREPGTNCLRMRKVYRAISSIINFAGHYRYHTVGHVRTRYAKHPKLVKLKDSIILTTVVWKTLFALISLYANLYELQRPFVAIGQPPVSTVSVIHQKTSTKSDWNSSSFS